MAEWHRRLRRLSSSPNIISTTISGHPRPGTGPKYSGTEMTDTSAVNVCNSPAVRLICLQQRFFNLHQPSTRPPPSGLAGDNKLQIRPSVLFGLVFCAAGRNLLVCFAQWLIARGRHCVARRRFASPLGEQTVALLKVNSWAYNDTIAFSQSVRHAVWPPPSSYSSCSSCCDLACCPQTRRPRRRLQTRLWLTHKLQYQRRV